MLHASTRISGLLHLGICSRWKEAAKGPFTHRCDECIINALTQLRCSWQSGHRVTRACVAAEPPSRAA